MRNCFQFKTKLINLVRPPRNPRLKFKMSKVSNGYELSSVIYQQFRHNFNCASPLCQTGIEDNEHYLLHYPRFADQRRIMLDLVSRTTNINIMLQPSKDLHSLLLHGDSNSNVMINRVILEATLKYIKNSRRFDRT